ncbi:FixH family protein [Prolixibacteraceae bacterium Z1-6]|uniref:FixH family protein n=1 Tax=Draconibacterium aestuarii TaxID=2998507 RepID=A0A9X3F5Y4_9BACT|nr:FixH family protein [Prolixibacteraceae bacterium Z1-6]
MKFNWGTGIFLFLAVFLAACAVFIYFAMSQQVNLVHKDYYEKGVDYSEQMKVNDRSKAFARSIKVSSSNNILSIEIEESLAKRVESGTMYMYRPSDKTKDIKVPVTAGLSQVQFQKSDLIPGRYILKFTWFMEGLKYEVNQPVNVQ